jgi:hypothetical protein
MDHVVAVKPDFYRLSDRKSYLVREFKPLSSRWLIPDAPPLLLAVNADTQAAFRNGSDYILKHPETVNKQTAENDGRRQSPGGLRVA